MAGSNKTTTANTVPAYLQEASKGLVSRATGVSNIGYTPYYGPDVAAMTPAQIAAMQGTNTAASAFGLPTVDPMAGMPTATNYGGINAYSSGTGYEAALAELKARFPAQFAAIMSQFIDPITGLMAGASNTAQSSSPSMPQIVASLMNPSGSGGGGGYTGGGSGSGAGYTSIRDMYDGGGPGKSGSTFSGGPLSNAANKAGISPAESSSSKSTGGSNATRR